MIDLPGEMKTRSLIAYAQVDDTHAFAFGGSDAEDGRARNDGVLVDLDTGGATYVEGPRVGAPLTRTTAATATNEPIVALAGLQCARFDGKYMGEDLNTTDACPPGPVTLSVYNAASDSWSTPTNAPYDYGQAFLPTIIGFVGNRVYIEIRVYGSRRSRSDYIRFDLAAQSWARIAAPPAQLSACLGVDQVAGIAYDGDGPYTNPRVVTYDPSTDDWTSHPVPHMQRSEWYGISCTPHSIVVRNEPAPQSVGRWASYSLADNRWTELPAPSLRFLGGAPNATAAETLVVWQGVSPPGTQPASSASITIGPDARWMSRVAPPVGHGGRGGLSKYAHAGTHVMSVDQSAILTADLAHLGSPAGAAAP